MFYSTEESFSGPWSWLYSSSVWLLPVYHPFRLLNSVSFFSSSILVPIGYIRIFKFRQRQNKRVSGLSERAKISRKQRNLVSVKFNLLNWMLDTVSLGLVMISGEDYQIVYLLVISCGNPLFYILGIVVDRKNEENFSKSNIRIFKRQGQLDFGDRKQGSSSQLSGNETAITTCHLTHLHSFFS